MRDALIMALAKHAGETVTPQLARALLDELFPDRTIDPGQFPPRACGSVTFAVERLRDIVEEIHPLHEAHWRETEGYRHGLAMAPDYAAMLDDERAGGLLQVTARKNGRLVGQLRLYIRTSRHTSTRVASEDTLFLLSEVRGGRTAMRMVQFSEDVLLKLGVTQVKCNSKLVNNAAKFMEGCGYTPFATELVKFLTPMPPTGQKSGGAVSAPTLTGKEPHHEPA